MKKDWVNILFLTLTPVIGVAGTALYTWYAGFSLWMPLLLVAMYLAVGMSICAGYHRFFSHKSYEASAPPDFLRHLRSPGRTELDPLVVGESPGSSQVRGQGLGSVQHPARLLVGAHVLDLLQERAA
jgi:hypothetical protein